MARTEQWRRRPPATHGLVVLEVQGDPSDVEGGEFVIVSVELMTELLTELGFERVRG